MNDDVKVLRISETTRLRIVYDGNYELDDLSDWEGIVRAYSWDRHEWHLIYGERGEKAVDTDKFYGYSQGQVLRIHHNNADKAMLESFEDIWRGNVYGFILEEWNPTPGVGWDTRDSIWGVTGVGVYNDDDCIKHAKEFFGDDAIAGEYI